MGAQHLMSKAALRAELDNLLLQRDHFRAEIRMANEKLTNHRHRLVLLARSNRKLREKVGEMKEREVELNKRIGILEMQLKIKWN